VVDYTGPEAMLRSIRSKVALAGWRLRGHKQPMERETLINTRMQQQIHSVRLRTTLARGWCRGIGVLSLALTVAIASPAQEAGSARRDEV